jgi:hypothetical protein
MPKAPKLNLIKSLRGGNRDFLLLAKGNVPYYVTKIKGSVKARQFADLLKSDRAVRRLFLHQWKQLSCSDEVSVPLLFGTDSSEDEEELVSQFSRSKEQEATFTVERLLDDAAPAIEDAMKRLQARLKSVVGGKGAVDPESVVIALLRTAGLFSGANPLSSISRIAKPFEDYFVDEAPSTALMFLEASKSRVLAYGMSRRRAIIRDSGISDADYEHALRRLSDDGFISPAGSLVWCRRHGHAPFSYYAIGHQVPRVRASCDTCGHKLVCGTFYLLQPPAMMIARHYEGAIPYLMAWDLEKESYRWNAHVFLAEEQDSEKDLVFLLKGRGQSPGATGIVECKTYRTDTSERIVEENLRRDLGQLDRHVDSYVSRKIPVGLAMLACNYEATEKRVSFASGLIASSPKLANLRKVGFRLIGIDDLKEWWIRPKQNDSSVS